MPMSESEALVAPVIKNGAAREVKQNISTAHLPTQQFLDEKGRPCERDVAVHTMRMDGELAKAVADELKPGDGFEAMPAAIKRAVAKLQGKGKKKSEVRSRKLEVGSQEDAPPNENEPEEYVRWLVACIRNQYGLDAQFQHMSPAELQDLVALMGVPLTYADWRAQRFK